MRLFDTTFVIDLINGDKGAEKLARTVDEEKSLAAVSVITMHEYLLGVHLAHAGEKAFEERLSSARNDIERFDVIPMTRETVEVSASMHASLIRGGTQIGINDVYIAATAMMYNLTLVTRNKSHFEKIKGLSIEGY